MPINRGRINKFQRASDSPILNPGISYSDNYTDQKNTSIRRHEYSTILPFLSGSSKSPGSYGFLELLKFKRSFGGVTNGEPTATASNNYQTPEVMNGSRIVNYNAEITLKMALSQLGSVSGAYLDVYEVCLSYFDAFLWNSIQPTACPVTFDSTTTVPADIRGEVASKTPTTTLIADNTIKNFTFIQHYMKKKGTVYLEGSLDNPASQVNITIDYIPPKVRRSNMGMYWALYFQNDANKNNSQAITVDASAEISFDEIPSDLKIPYLN